MSKKIEFEYVVQREKQAKVCFGSTQARILKSSSVNPKKLTKPGPLTYNIKPFLFQYLNKVRSNKGVPGLCNGAPRFQRRTIDRTPSPTRYETSPKWPQKKDMKAPFGTNTKRVTFKINKLPGPGTYNLEAWKCRRTRFEDNFRHPVMIPTVEEICIPTPIDVCSKCERICTGDYWEQNHTIFLCNPCRTEEIKLSEMYTKEDLKDFKKIRNCVYKHRHEGTTAAIRLLSKNKIDKKHQLENYLDLYIKC